MVLFHSPDSLFNKSKSMLVMVLSHIHLLALRTPVPRSLRMATENAISQHSHTSLFTLTWLLIHCTCSQSLPCFKMNLFCLFPVWSKHSISLVPTWPGLLWCALIFWFWLMFCILVFAILSWSLCLACFWILLIVSYFRICSTGVLNKSSLCTCIHMQPDSYYETPPSWRLSYGGKLKYTF